MKPQLILRYIRFITGWAGNKLETHSSLLSVVTPQDGRMDLIYKDIILSSSSRTKTVRVNNERPLHSFPDPPPVIIYRCYSCSSIFLPDSRPGFIIWSVPLQFVSNRMQVRFYRNFVSDTWLVTYTYPAMTLSVTSTPYYTCSTPFLLRIYYRTCKNHRVSWICHRSCHTMWIDGENVIKKTVKFQQSLHKWSQHYVILNNTHQSRIEPTKSASEVYPVLCKTPDTQNPKLLPMTIRQWPW